MSYLSSLNLSFLIYTMEIILHSAVMQLNREKAHTLLSKVTGKYSVLKRY